MAKTDFHPNDHNVISARFIYANTNQIEEDATPVASQWLSQASPITQVFGVDWAWVPNSSWTNDVRFSYNSFNEKIAPVDSNVDPKTYGLNTGITDPRLFGFPAHQHEFAGHELPWWKFQLASLDYSQPYAKLF